MVDNTNLFENFSPTSRAEWEEAINKDLHGADYKTRLKWQTGEGIEALPFYRSDDLNQLSASTLKGPADWEIRQAVYESKVAKANKIGRKAIENGADALEFIFDISRAGAAMDGDIAGPAIQNQAAFTRLLADIDLSRTAFHFDCARAAPVILAMLHNEMELRESDQTNLKGSVLYDPYAFIITSGQLPKDEKRIYDEFGQMVDFCNAHLPDVKCLGVDGRAYHRAGGTIVQELGYALAAGSEFLAKLSETGMEVDTIASAIHFNFSIGSGYFPEIAKFRAARKLWSNILDEYEVNTDQKMYIHGSSSKWNKTRYDPYVNMLRTSTEGMSAAIAGCDAVTLHPFDVTFRQPDQFSRRIARNAQIILKEEAYFNKVADPAAGSYYVEILTDKIARAAWNCFREVEHRGGMLQSVRDGYIQDAISESRRERDEAIARRKRIFVGTNQYPNTNDEAPNEQQAVKATQSLQKTGQEADINADQLMAALKKALQKGRTLGDIIPALFDYQCDDIQSIVPYRGPQAFEALREATEDQKTTPQVLTLPIGNKKMRKARSAFAVNFFGCAGYDIADPIGFDTIDAAVYEIKEKEPDIAVLCSSDDEYENLVPKLCSKLNKLNQRPIMVLAGCPKKQAEAYKNAGIDVFIHNQSNVLETLKDFQNRLGIVQN